MRQIVLLIISLALTACGSLNQSTLIQNVPVKATLFKKHQKTPMPEAESMKKPNISLAQAVQNAHAATASDESGIYPLTSGVEAFAVRNALIKNAQTSLDLQYYSLHRGLSSRLLIREMVRAADRGVHVRILVDDMDMLGRDHEMTVLSAHPNIDVRIFNPIRYLRGTMLTRTAMFALKLRSQHRRMHNKVWLADGVLAITGGRNIGDRYFNASNSDNFADLDVLLSGQVVRKMANSFDEYWNAPQVLPVEAFEKNPEGNRDDIQKMIFKTNALTRKERVARHPYLTALNDAEQKVLPTLLPQMVWGAVDFFADQPNKVTLPANRVGISVPAERSVPFNALLPYIQNAQKQVLIISPYFIPGDEFSKVLTDLVARGVGVTLLTNSLESNDVPLVNGPYERYRLPLLQAGVKIYELRGFPDVDKAPQWRLPIFSWQGSRTALHTKAVVVDDTISFVGSMNLDPRSIVWNTEVGVIAQQKAFANQIKALFMSAIERKYSYQLTLDAKGRIHWSASVETQNPLTREPGNFWRRLQRNIAVSAVETFL